eukprot:TRINITY_DN4915_c0_g1_i4.p1 TRINITY_DN4915_c0_g1~~TRINITY_DN4915_c0_g1_i4.p1  ORF type:complete len:1172 (+),score=124.10 TRINITY_DN4915_c0_g1_i4:812-4327(+)
MLSLPIRIGDSSGNSKFYVSEDIRHTAIFGMPALVALKVTIVPHKARVVTPSKMKVKAISSVEIRKFRPAFAMVEEISEVRELKKIHLPAGRRTMLRIRAPEGFQEGETVRIIPSQVLSNRYKYLRTANSIDSVCGGKIWVQVAHFGNKDIFLPPLTPIASVESIDDFVDEICEIGISSDPRFADADETKTSHSVREKENEPNTLEDKNKIYEEVVEALNTVKFSESLTDEQKMQLRKLLLRNADCFATELRHMERVKGWKHSINTGSADPIRARPNRQTFFHQGQIRDFVRTHKSDGLIRDSTSPWAAPLVMVPKPDGSTRVCVDFRKLNSVTTKDVYPLPRIDETLESLSSAVYLSSMDMIAGYWQMEIEEEDKHKTAFITREGLYEWNVMPMGLTNAPASFQRMMNHMINGISFEWAMVYLDDLIIYSKSWEEHLTHLEEIFTRMRKLKLRAKVSKCKFAFHEMKYLGHIVSKDGIRADPEKIKIMEEFVTPKNTQAVYRFVGIASYYRRFIKGFAEIAEPLHRLTRLNVPFVWTEECEKAFQELKNRLISQPILRHPNFSKPFIIATDASKVDISAILSQKDERGLEYVIAYSSRLLSDSERRYSTPDRECLAVYWGIETYRMYVYGTEFTIISDHSPLQYLSTIEPKGVRGKWQMELQAYNFKVVHKAGKLHTNADGLTRLDRGEVNEVVEIEKEEGNNLVELDLSDDRIAQLQREDPVLIQIIRYLEEGEITVSRETAANWINWVRDFKLSGGILYRLSYQNNGIGNGNDRLVIPSVLKIQVLESTHNDLWGGHMGVAKTYHRLQLRYYWKSMWEDVKLHVLHCTSCGKRKKAKHVSLPITPIVSSYPFELVSVDFIGPFKRTRKGNRYVAVFVDHFSKWMELKACRDNTAESAAKALVDEVINRHGTPPKLLSDRGGEFTSIMSQRLYKLFEIYKLNTTPYHPQTNGGNERSHGTLYDILSHYINQSTHSDWDEFLSFARFAYNTCVHTATGFTPYFIVHAREAQTPLSLWLEREQEMEPERLKMEELAWELFNKAQKAYSIAAMVHAQNAQRISSQGNLRTINNPFQVGQWVLHYYPRGLMKEKQRKMGFPYHGPYRILEIISPVLCRLDFRGERKIPSVVRIDCLKGFSSKDDGITNGFPINKEAEERWTKKMDIEMVGDIF